jgi:Uma2 family endonuclease
VNNVPVRRTKAAGNLIAPPDHLLSFDEWVALVAGDDHYYELVDGVLVIAPQPSPRHQLAVWRLIAQLERDLPHSITVVAQTELVIDAGSPPTVRVPDVLMVPSAALAVDPDRVRPDDALLAAEIVAPGSRRTDRMAKVAEYAAAGVEHYWVIEPDSEVELTAYRLRNGHYELRGEYSAGSALEVAGTPITLDLTGLTSLRIAQ